MSQLITVVSLGNGNREYLTLGALDALKAAKKIILRTEKCDAAAYLRENGLCFETLDDLHETCSTFEELTRACVKRVRAAAKEKMCATRCWTPRGMNPPGNCLTSAARGRCRA